MDKTQPPENSSDDCPGTAELQLGSFGVSPHLGWYSRGYLPHRDHPGLLQFITYRLADSLPENILNQIEEELKDSPSNERETKRRRRLEAKLDAGHGSCILNWPQAARCVVDAWRFFGGKRYDLIAWVVMPNHVHVLVRVYEGGALGKIVQSWKSYTGRQIKEMLNGRAGARRSQEKQIKEERFNQAKSVWMRDYWDRFIRDEKHFRAAIRYIHENPVKAGLVEKAADWPWSSAKEFEEIKNKVGLEVGVSQANPSGLGQNPLQRTETLSNSGAIPLRAGENPSDPSDSSGSFRDSKTSNAESNDGGIEPDDGAETVGGSPRKIRIMVRDRQTVEAPPMTYALNALLRGGAAVYHLCGGGGSCGTCRIRILEGARNCSPPSSREKETRKRLGLRYPTRLACQTKIVGDVEIEILLKNEKDLAEATGGTARESETV